jgi:hypothetical protein
VQDLTSSAGMLRARPSLEAGAAGIAGNLMYSGESIMTKGDLDTAITRLHNRLYRCAITEVVFDIADPFFRNRVRFC